jgi:hypothetical protein
MFSILDAILEWLRSIGEFFSEGIYQLIVDGFSYLIEILTLWSIQFTVWSSGFAWDIAKNIITDLGISDKLNQAWGIIPVDTVNILAFFGIPELISMLVTAIITSYVLKFIPFSGK